ncbi:SleB-like protein [Sphingomonas paucimobilis]|nr:SleB-like protein [Sphingomonas paucimobilis]
MGTSDCHTLRERKRRLRLAVGFLVLLLLVAGLFWLGWRHHTEGRNTASRRGAEIVLKLPSPPVILTPFATQDIAPEEAKKTNARMPYSTRPNKAAKPLIFSGSPVDEAAALTCLASALWYEAGDDQIGQQAVAQVVLNRLRHPAFPKTICAVVFQGADRQTGCQFTFTCDGALSRSPSAAAWRRAREVANRALAGYVFKPVGTATHYHTNWVVPYWAGTLDKIVEIRTHIFYRWPGWWGEPAAFTGRYLGGERLNAGVARLAEPVARPAEWQTASLPTKDIQVAEDHNHEANPWKSIPINGVSLAELKGNIARLIDDANSIFLLQLSPNTFPGSYAIAAHSICKDRRRCLVIGWIRPSLVPHVLPVTPSQMTDATFVYRRNKALNIEESLWNCKSVPREDLSQCRPGTEPTKTETK